MAYGLTSVREVRNAGKQSTVSIMTHNELQIIHPPHKSLT